MHLRSFTVTAIVAATLLVFSCATYRIRTESVPTMPPNADALRGKSVGVLPTTVSFGASRFAIDLRDVKVTVNGQEVKLQDRHIAKDDDIALGKVGVLDVDILGKSKVDKAALGAFCQDVLVEGLGGKRDYNVPFFKGLGESNMGALSNRPYTLDRSVYPPKEVYADGPSPATLFSSVAARGAGSIEGVDLVLRSEISISSEILEVLEGPSSSISVDDKPIMKGDYFLSLFGSYRFSLVDAKTGAVVADEKTKGEWTTQPVLVRNMRVPAANGDAEAYAKYFRTVDFNAYARVAAAAALESVLPLFTPFYVNTYHSEKVEKAAK